MAENYPYCKDCIYFGGDRNNPTSSSNCLYEWPAYNAPGATGKTNVKYARWYESLCGKRGQMFEPLKSEQTYITKAEYIISAKSYMTEEEAAIVFDETILFYYSDSCLENLLPLVDGELPELPIIPCPEEGVESELVEKEKDGGFYVRHASKIGELWINTWECDSRILAIAKSNRWIRERYKVKYPSVRKHKIHVITTSSTKNCLRCEFCNYDSFHNEQYCDHKPPPEGLSDRSLIYYYNCCDYFSDRTI